MFIIIIGWSSERPFWARRFGSSPSTLNVLFVAAGMVVAAAEVAGEDTEGFDAGESLETENGVGAEFANRYLRFFWRKTGYASTTPTNRGEALT
jgi:hypothetical protein